MKEWFTIVEYLRCPHCNMVFDPKGIKICEDDSDDEDEIIECRFCHQKAPLNRGEREKRI